MSSPTTPPPRPVRALGPAIVVVLIIIAAALGYYQIIVYPPNHSSTTTLYVLRDPHNVTVTILPGAVNDCLPPTGTGCNNKTYSPDVITVTIGYNATVIWHNDDITAHTVTAYSNDSILDPRFTSFGPISPPTSWANLPTGQSVNFTFIKPGTYTYFCSYHPVWMFGSVIVKTGSNGSSSSTAGSTSISSSSAMLSPNHLGWFPILVDRRAVHLRSLTNVVTSIAMIWNANPS